MTKTNPDAMSYDERVRGQIEVLDRKCNEMLMDRDTFEYIRNHTAINHANDIINAIEILSAQLALIDRG